MKIKTRLLLIVVYFKRLVSTSCKRKFKLSLFLFARDFVIRLNPSKIRRFITKEFVEHVLQRIRRIWHPLEIRLYECSCYHYYYLPLCNPLVYNSVTSRSLLTMFINICNIWRRIVNRKRLYVKEWSTVAIWCIRKLQRSERFSWSYISKAVAVFHWPPITRMIFLIMRKIRFIVS